MRRSPIARRTPLRRSGRLNPVSAKAKREQPQIDAFRKVLRERSGGSCEAQTPACPVWPHPGEHAHHVLMRSQGGGHEPSNGLFVCRFAHRFIHDNPERSYAAGWLRRSAA